MRVLVTAAGSGPGVAVIKAIRRSTNVGEPNFVLATDMSPMGAGLYLADAWALVPPASDPEYPKAIAQVCKEHSLEMVIPILDLETPVIARSAALLESAGAFAAVNSQPAIDLANDKLKSAEVCAAEGIKQPPAWDLGHAPPEAYPLIGKPVAGVGSQGLVVLDKPGSVVGTASPEGYVWQSLVTGPEYSIDTWGDPTTNKFVAVPRHRRVVRSGQTVQGETVNDPDIIEFARKVCLAFAITDVACTQVIRSSTTGELVFVETNTRYGTGVSLSIAAGVDFPLLQYLGHTNPHSVTDEMLRFRTGLTMLRYWEEIYLD